MESDLDVDDTSSHENELRAETWFFKTTVCLNDDRVFSDVSDAHKQQVERSLSTVSDISWAACPDSNRSENSGAQQYEGFVHDGSLNQIRMGTLKLVLREKVVSDNQNHTSYL